jgi:hypothetical protein
MYKVLRPYSLHNFTSLHCFYMLYFTFVRSRLENISVVWHSVTSADASKFQRIQQKFASVCFYCDYNLLGDDAVWLL